MYENQTKLEISTFTDILWYLSPKLIGREQDSKPSNKNTW